MKIKPISRNDIAVVIAVLSALVVVAAPVSALFAVWKGDVRWLYTGAVLVVLSMAMYFVATRLFDDAPEAKR